MNIGTVVEGPTDRLVIKSIINTLCPGEHRFFDLQPQGAGDTFNEMGAGWKGVQRWCKETWKIHGSSLETILNEGSEMPLDLLIIHLDADIVLEDDLQAGMVNPIEGVPFPCPPASRNAQVIHLIVVRWLSLETLPDRVVLAIPSQDTENWTFAALHPADGLCQNVDYECIQQGGARNNHPAYRLTLEEYGKHLKRDGSRIKKPVKQYRQIADQVGINWKTVCRICTQAAAFHKVVAGFLEARSGKVHLLRRDELNPDWDPIKDKRLTAWEAAQYLIRALDKEGEKGGGALLGKLGAVGEIARDLAYRLYTICERKGWAQESLAYNMLVVAWPRIREQMGKQPMQQSLL